MTSSGSASYFRLLEPVEYVQDYLKKGLHPPGGRKLLDFRSTSLQTNLLSSADGSSLVRHGNTTVIASIKGELSEPDFRSDFNDRGRILLSVDGQPYFTDYQTACLNDVSAIIKNLLDASKIVDLKSLCIRKGQLCWTLYVDVNCLDCDGAVFETCLLAVVAAFYYATLPIVHIEDDRSIAAHDNNRIDLEEEPQQQLRPPAVGEIFAPFFNADDNDWPTTTIDFDEPSNNSNIRVDFKIRQPIKLARSLPVASGFLLFNIEQAATGNENVAEQGRRHVLACDPTEEEKNVFPNNDFSLVYTSIVPTIAPTNRPQNIDERHVVNEALYGMYKFGGSVSINEATLDQCVDLARRRCLQVLRLIDQAKPSTERSAAATIAAAAAAASQ